MQSLPVARRERERTSLVERCDRTVRRPDGRTRRDGRAELRVQQYEGVDDEKWVRPREGDGGVEGRIVEQRDREREKEEKEEDATGENDTQVADCCFCLSQWQQPQENQKKKKGGTVRSKKHEEHQKTQKRSRRQRSRRQAQAQVLETAAAAAATKCRARRRKEKGTQSRRTEEPSVTVQILKEENEESPGGFTSEKV